MPAAEKPSDGDPAARAVRALERSATALTTAMARTLYDRWRRMPATQRERIERIAAEVKGGADTQPTAARIEPVQPDRDVSEIEVHDLRSELARELERLAQGDVRAARGPGRPAGETAPADSQP